MEFYPLTFEPIYKEKIWGGEGLNRIFFRDLPGDKIGESWELAAHERGTSTVNNGPFQGERITTLVDKYPEEILGDRAHNGKTRFPLLFKFLDANDKLSLQVHPDDRYTTNNPQEEGKTEIWYILEAQPGAEIVYGLKPGTDRKTLGTAIKNRNLLKYLKKIRVKKGDVFFIPPGTVHALGEGIILAEIQQNSDTTYRLYDYDRPGSDGKPRPLHIEKALDVIDFENIQLENKTLTTENDIYRRSFLTACPFFVVEKIDLFKSQQIQPAGASFYVLLILSGEGRLHHQNLSLQLKPGRTVLLPAALKEVIIEGELEYLMTYLPPERDDLLAGLKDLGFTREEISKFLGQ